MGFTLSEVKEDAEFKPLWLAFRAGFTNPGNALWPLFMGDWQPQDAAAREVALEESRTRFISWHRANPTSTWLQVVDDETGEVVAGGRWSIYTTDNLYDGHGAMEATWFAPEAREVATTFLNQFLGTASRNANRPHAFLNILFTTPKYRRMGAASMIMDWGFEKAKKLGLDVYIEATKEGKPLYEAHGMKAVQVIAFVVDMRELSSMGNAEVQRKVADSMTPFTWWSMFGTPAKR